MTVQIVTESLIKQWLGNGVIQAVETYLATNPLTDIPTIAAACKDSNGVTLTYAQVAFALDYPANPTTNAVMALPSQDSEIPIVMAMNAVWDK